MAYATLQQLIDRFGEAMLIALTDRGPVEQGAIDTAVVDRAALDADAMINGYLAGRYQPLVTVPALIADIASAIMIWKLHITTPEDKIKADYDAALRTLRDIASGLIRIPDAAGLEPASSGASGVVVTDRDRPFSADNMTGFI
jgi:phage gp36-like protein